MTFGRRPPGWHECWQRPVVVMAEGLRNSSDNCREQKCHQRRGGVSEGGMSGRKSETNRELQRTGDRELEVGEDRSSGEALVTRVEQRVLTLWMRTGEGKER